MQKATSSRVILPIIIVVKTKNLNFGAPCNEKITKKSKKLAAFIITHTTKQITHTQVSTSQNTLTPLLINENASGSLFSPIEIKI